MGPVKKGSRASDHKFLESEKLYKRIPVEHLSEGEIDPSLIQCSFDKGVKSAPSVVREKYSCPGDTLHPCCAGGKDVSSQRVYYVEVGELPKGIESGDKKSFDFFPYHQPEEECYAHSVIACRRSGTGAEDYVQPNRLVKNAFKAKLISKLRQADMPTFPRNILCDIRKCVAAMKQGL